VHHHARVPPTGQEPTHLSAISGPFVRRGAERLAQWMRTRP
jgi:hypothetical protein